MPASSSPLSPAAKAEEGAAKAASAAGGTHPIGRRRTRWGTPPITGGSRFVSTGPRAAPPKPLNERYRRARGVEHAGDDTELPSALVPEVKQPAPRYLQHVAGRHGLARWLEKDEQQQVRHGAAYRRGTVPVSRYCASMSSRPEGVPHSLSWVRRVDDVSWERGLPPGWGLTPARELDDRELALELARCAVDRDITLTTAAKLIGVGRDRAHRVMDQLREEVAPRRGHGHGPLSDSGIYKRLRAERRRSGRICLAPGCDNPINRRKRLGTYACSGTCRKRIFDAGGRDAVIARANEAERDRRLAEREAKRLAKLPRASSLIVRCGRCERSFTGPTARDEFKAHRCATTSPTREGDPAGQQSGSKRTEGTHAAITGKPARAQKNACD